MLKNKVLTFFLTDRKKHAAQYFPVQRKFKNHKYVLIYNH